MIARQLAIKVILCDCKLKTAFQAITKSIMIYYDVTHVLSSLELDVHLHKALSVFSRKMYAFLLHKESYPGHFQTSDIFSNVRRAADRMMIVSPSQNLNFEPSVTSLKLPVLCRGVF